MKRSPIVGTLMLIPAFLMLVAVGCGPAKTPPPASPPAASAPGKAGDNAEKPKGKAEEITTALEGTVKGMVKYDGKPPEAKPNLKIAEHEDAKKGLCGAVTDQLDQVWIIGKDGGVAGVVIKLVPPAGKKFKITDKLKEESKKTVYLDQPFCNFVPHVVALWPATQTLETRNEAKINHNVKLGRGEKAGLFNAILSPGQDKKIDMADADTDVPLSATCDIHGWMSAKVFAFRNPYFAVTDKDGKFDIKHVPVDTEYTTEWWHESTGKWTPGPKVAVKKGDNDLKLEIK